MQTVPARSVVFGPGVLMSAPSPLGRLARRRRLMMGITQPELAKRVGCNQNDISRLETGKTQRFEKPERLNNLAKELGYEGDVDFILAAYAPTDVYARWRAGLEQIEVLPLGPEGDLIAIMREWPESRKRRAVDRMLKTPQDEGEAAEA